MKRIDPRRDSGVISRFIVLRMIIAALVFGAGIMILQLTHENFPVKPLYVLFGVCYLTGGLLYLASKMNVDPRAGVWGIILTDIVLETAIVHYSGGTASQFSLIFYLTIIAAALMLQVPGGLGSALAASLAYVSYGILTNKGYLVPPNDGFVSGSKASFLQSYLHVSIFLLVGAVAGYLSERMRLKGIQLQHAETRLKQLKVDTDNILNHMSSGVLVVDSEGKIITVNPAAEEILGVRRDEILLRNLDETLSSTMPELVREVETALIKGKTKFRHEITVENMRHRMIPLGISISLLRDDNDEKRGAIAVFQDLTEVRRMQERIRKADRLAAIGELSAGIAHEIRNPLASISGSIEMLYNDLDLTGENKRLMELIMKESDRLDRIIGDFLEFARMRPPAAGRLSMRKVLEETLTLLKNSNSFRNNVTLELDCPEEEIWINADEEQLRQVLLNLAINACEAMEEGGRLGVEAKCEGEKHVRITFSDEGPGIEEEAMERLFEPFFTTKDGGTGLGLAVANKIIEAHGGTLTFRNREGGGAEFTLVLPVSGAVDANVEGKLDAVGF